MASGHVKVFEDETVSRGRGRFIWSVEMNVDE